MKLAALLLTSIVPLFQAQSAAADTCPTTPIVTVICGNAFGACSSAAEVTQMNSALAGLGTVTIARMDYPGGKFPAPANYVLDAILSAPCPDRPMFIAGRSAGAWAAAIGSLMADQRGVHLAGIISYFGPLDLATLWQKNEWGAVNSPRGPINLLMPWGFPGCSDCNLPFPPGDAFYFNVNDEGDPSNSQYMQQALVASPIHYLTPSSPPLFLTQGTNDGIIGQYKGESQAARMYHRAGDRPGDKLVICNGLAHGYNFDNACPVSALRAWFQQSVEAWNARPKARIFANATANALMIGSDSVVTISWQSANVTSCTVKQDDLAAAYSRVNGSPVSGSWTGPTWAGTNGPGVTVAPWSDAALRDVSYKLICTGPAGTATSQVRVRRFNYAAGGRQVSARFRGAAASLQAYFFAVVQRPRRTSPSRSYPHSRSATP